MEQMVEEVVESVIVNSKWDGRVNLTRLQSYSSDLQSRPLGSSLLCRVPTSFARLQPHFPGCNLTFPASILLVRPTIPPAYNPARQVPTSFAMFQPPSPGSNLTCQVSILLAGFQPHLLGFNLTLTCLALISFVRLQSNSSDPQPSTRPQSRPIDSNLIWRVSSSPSGFNLGCKTSTPLT